MDAIVEAALKKWPNVPHCYGWLALDARGDWYMRDDRIQRAGPFPRVKGSRIEHDKLREFIARNYAADESGAWFFQNGPQRVYVELEAAPWVWRLQPGAGEVRVHEIGIHLDRLLIIIFCLSRIFIGLIKQTHHMIQEGILWHGFNLCLNPFDRFFVLLLIHIDCDNKVQSF